MEEALRTAKQELEMRVSERTAQLGHANEQLQSELTERKRADEALLLQTVKLEAEVAERQKAQRELQILNEELEQWVQERTAELEEKNADLQKMNKVFVGRELRMVELKERIRELEVTISHE